MNFKTSYIYDLVDKISPKLLKINNSLKKSGTEAKKTAEKSANAFRRLNNSLKPIRNNVEKIRSSFKKFNSDIGTKLSAVFTAFTFLSLRGFNKQAQALETIRVGLQTTQNAAKLTFDTLRKEAVRLQKETLFGDEEILTGATAQLLTFTNISGQEFLRTQQAVLDVASRLSLAKDGAVDLTSTAIQLGKALNEPVGNLGALSRSGIQFSEEQKKMIKSFVKNNQLAKAQRLILSELETQYGGTAKALAKVGTGSIKQLMNAIGDLNEVIGKEQFKILEPYIKILRNMTERFDSLSPSTKKFIAKISLLAVVIAPLLAVLGVLIISISALLSPIGLVIVSIAGLTASAITFKDKFISAFNFVKNSIDSIINSITNKIDSLGNKLGKFAESLGFDFGIGKESELDNILKKQKKELALSSNQNINVGGLLGINISAPAGTNANFSPSHTAIKSDINFTQTNPLFN